MLAEFITTAVLAISQPAVEPAPVIDPPRQNRAFGIIAIPKLREKETVYVGTKPRQIDRGIGHLDGSPWPGQRGMTSLWGHRVTPVPGTFIHTRDAGPFRNIDRLRRGDRIIVTMPYGRYVYRVMRAKVIWDAPIEDTMFCRRCVRRGPERLVIAACHPPGSAAQRYVVIARPA